MSMYADYVKERLGDGVLEGEKGFVTFRYLNNKKSVYIVDIYIKPEFRKQHVASEMADIIVETAKKEGATELLGTVNPSSKNATASLKVLLGYGMILASCFQDVIVFKKEI